MTTMVHSTQIANPRCSAKIERTRFLRATLLPVEFQNASSSGSQWSIQRPLRPSTPRLPGPSWTTVPVPAAGADVVVPVVGASVVVLIMGAP